MYLRCFVDVNSQSLYLYDATVTDRLFSISIDIRTELGSKAIFKVIISILVAAYS